MFFQSFVPNAVAERDDFAPYESKSVPQRLKPSSAQPITARLNPCPSFDSLFPSLSGAVQIGQPKNLIWTGVVERIHRRFHDRFGESDRLGCAHLFRPRYALANLGHPSSSSAFLRSRVLQKMCELSELCELSGVWRGEEEKLSVLG